MAATTKQELLEQKKILLDAYNQAELQILQGAQGYKMGSRELTRADLSEVRKERKTLENEVIELESSISNGGRRKSYRITLRDL